MKSRVVKASNHRSQAAAPQDGRAKPNPAPRIREDVIKRAKQRIASGFYDSDVCLDITVRRLVRELKRPQPAVTLVSPGRTAERRSQESRCRG